MRAIALTIFLSGLLLTMAGCETGHLGKKKMTDMDRCIMTGGRFIQTDKGYSCSYDQVEIDRP